MSMPSSSDEVATRHGQLARLQQLLDDQPLLVGERAVVGPRDLLERLVRRLRLAVAGVLGRGELLLGPLVVELVEALGQALGAAAVVDEDDRRRVLADQRQQLRVDRGPDRARVDGRIDRADGVMNTERSVRLLRFASGGGRVSRRDGACRGLRHVVDRDDDLEVELLADAGVDDLALALRADEELGDPLERALGGREADPLRLAGCPPRRPGARAARASARGGRRAWTARRRGSRRRSPPRRR